MALSDEELIRDYLAGEEAAFETLLLRHLKAVYSFSLRLVGSETDAEDITQNTFLKAWKSLKRYDARTAKFKTWLMRIARNTAIDHLRKKSPLSFSDIENAKGEDASLQVPDGASSQEELLVRAQDVKALEKALERISASQREVILLHDMNGLTFEEIGDMLGESSNTLKSRYRRGIAALRELLAMHQKPR